MQFPQHIASEVISNDAEWLMIVKQVQAFARSAFVELWEVLRPKLEGIAEWPMAAKLFVAAMLLLAISGILASQVKGILHASRIWKQAPGSSLTFGYFTGTGSHQRKIMYKDARIWLSDGKWYGISSLSYRFGKMTFDSFVIGFLVSLGYLPIAALAFIEMLLRVGIGFVWLWAFSVIHKLILLVLGLLARLAIPIARAVDYFMRKQQHCPECYKTFRMPVFECPRCGEKYYRLVPGKHGIFVARCSCGKFLPCTAFTGRSRLEAICPECDSPLAASNAEQFSIQLVGGASAGKTAFLAAFQHIYRDSARTAKGIALKGEPDDLFEALEDMYMEGISHSTSGGKPQTYTLVHDLGGTQYKLAIYDVPGEAIVNDSYSVSPVNLTYCKGIIFVIDPLSVASVRQECIDEGLNAALVNHSQDDTVAVVEQFSQQFARITGLSSKKRSDVPVAVIISKADVRPVWRRIGKPRVLATHRQRAASYGGTLTDTRDFMCKEYLEEIGLGNITNHIDAAFSSVKYFPVSAIGRVAGKAIPYEPIGVMEPVAWIARTGAARIADIFAAAEAAEGGAEE